MNRTRGKLALVPRYTVQQSPVDARREVAPEVSVDEPRIRMPGEGDADEGRPMAFWKAAVLLGLLSLAFAALVRFLAVLSP